MICSAIACVCSMSSHDARDEVVHNVSASKQAAVPHDYHSEGTLMLGISRQQKDQWELSAHNHFIAKCKGPA